ncbi:MAG: guanylate kinase [Verrucomicrobiae bacterium]|nr:guanylate kinase [Verrucomicrobiae bacterium]
MPERTVAPLLLLLSAPSGAGKTTVGQRLLETQPNLDRAVTCTTRPARPGERDGVDYYFLDRPAFDQRLAEDAFLEHAEVYGNRYGTLRSEVVRRLEAGRDVLLTVDVQGAEAVRRVAASGDPVLGPALVSAFLMPPSWDELQRRLTGRNQDAPGVIERRLAAARDEVDRWPTFDYVIVSAGKDEDLAAMEHILAAERLRARRTRRLVIDGSLTTLRP